MNKRERERLKSIKSGLKRVEKSEKEREDAIEVEIFDDNISDHKLQNDCYKLCYNIVKMSLTIVVSDIWLIAIKTISTANLFWLNGHIWALLYFEWSHF